MSIFSRVCDSKAEDPFNCALFKCYKFMKGRTGSMLSRTKYVKCFRVETIAVVTLQTFYLGKYEIKKCKMPSVFFFWCHINTCKFMLAYFYTHDRNFTWINLHVLMWHQNKNGGHFTPAQSSFAIFVYPPTPRFMTRRQFFPACPPFVNTVYYKFNLFFFCFFKISNEVAIFNSLNTHILMSFFRIKKII